MLSGKNLRFSGVHLRFRDLLTLRIDGFFDTCHVSYSQSVSKNSPPTQCAVLHSAFLCGVVDHVFRPLRRSSVRNTREDARLQVLRSKICGQSPRQFLYKLFKPNIRGQTSQTAGQGVSAASFEECSLLNVRLLMESLLCCGPAAACRVLPFIFFSLVLVLPFLYPKISPSGSLHVWWNHRGLIDSLHYMFQFQATTTQSYVLQSNQVVQTQLSKYLVKLKRSCTCVDTILRVFVCMLLVLLPSKPF